MADLSGKMLIILVVLHCCYPGYARLQQGYFSFKLDKHDRTAVIEKRLFANTSIKVQCNPYHNTYGCAGTLSLYVWWFPCVADLQHLLGKGEFQSSIKNLIKNTKHYSSFYQQEMYLQIDYQSYMSNEYTLEYPQKRGHTTKRNNGTYIFILSVDPENNAGFHDEIISGTLQLEGPQGYLSRTEWPLLPFYCIMVALYVVCGLVWCTEIVRWWDRKNVVWVRNCIAFVLLLGIVEYATFLEDVMHLNYDGESMPGVQITAELLSSVKRTVAVIVSILVSLGHGVTSPSCGAMLAKVIGVGFLYLFTAATAGFVRAFTDNDNVAVVSSSIPLSVLDATLGCVILCFVAKTTAKLSASKNKQEHTLYKHFRDTLILFGAVSAGFYIGIASRKQLASYADPQNDLLEDGVWHILFFLVLLVTMVLWRPSVKYNKRPDYSPLCEDEPSEHDDDDDKLLDLSTDTDVGATGVNTQNNAVVEDKKTKENCYKPSAEETRDKEPVSGGFKAAKTAIKHGIRDTFMLRSDVRCELKAMRELKMKNELEKSDLEITNVKLENELLRMKIAAKIQEQPQQLEQPHEPQQLEQPNDPQQLEQPLEPLQMEQPQIVDQQREPEPTLPDNKAEGAVGPVPVHQFSPQYKGGKLMQTNQ